MRLSVPQQKALGWYARPALERGPSPATATRIKLFELGLVTSSLTFNARLTEQGVTEARSLGYGTLVEQTLRIQEEDDARLRALGLDPLVSTGTDSAQPWGQVGQN